MNFAILTSVAEGPLPQGGVGDRVLVAVALELVLAGPLVAARKRHAPIAKMPVPEKLQIAIAKPVATSCRVAHHPT